MNKVKWLELGGAPLRNDDWEYDADAVRDALSAITKIFGDNFIITGFTVSGLGTNNTTWTAGTVVLNGEVYKINASSSPIDTNANTFWYIEPDISNDVAGDVVMEDGSTKHLYETRTAKLTAYASPQPGKQLYVITKRTDLIINEKILDHTHNFSKRQSMAQGEDNVATNGSNIINLTSYESGNSYNLNISTANVPLTRFSAGMPDGSHLVIRFTGTGKVVIADGVATSNGIDTGGNSYSFSTGELAYFVWMDGKARLINRNNQIWVTANPTVDSMVLASAVSNVSFRWDIRGRTVHCRFFYNITATAAGHMYIIFNLPLGMVASEPQCEGALTASYPDGTYPHFGSCRIGNGSNFTKMVHSINDVSGAGTVQIRGTITFEIE